MDSGHRKEGSGREALFGLVQFFFGLIVAVLFGMLTVKFLLIVWEALFG